MSTIGADIVIQILRERGVDVIFGFPGANSLPLNDRLMESPIRHYLVRHEQAAAHAADGYARATGKVGVCLSTSGPGATNMVTGIATAYMDSSPLVALTAQVNTSLLGRDAFQETDIISMTIPVTKHSFQVKDVHSLASNLREAFDIATSGRPGPVLVDLPRDILAAKCDPAGPADEPRRNGIKNGTDGREAIERIARALNQSERPVIIIGGGVKLANACDLMGDLITRTQIPFVTTMMGVGSVNAANGLNLGFIGSHGFELANSIVHQSDFILAVGTRFTDRSTSRIDEFAPLAMVAHIDIDPTSISKNVKADLHYSGDALDALQALTPMIEPKDRLEWMNRIHEERSTMDEKTPDRGCGPAGEFIRRVQEALPDGTMAVADVGLNQIWTVRSWRTRTPRCLLTSGGMGTMGFSVPAAIGAKIGAADRSVIAITGDGGFYMNMQELATIRYYNLPVKIVVFNNGHLGMIRQIQNLFFDGRYNSIELGGGTDFVAAARAFGIPASRVRIDNAPDEGIDALAKTDGPYLLEAVVDCENYVFPIIPPGRSNVEMIFGQAD
ncbi:MAG TPA: biosynthetic-type acetolactate synthase large subunit [Syntrophales bacterium]|nr:biosynthetic-type acetolactate synthase large subunit [Syntrophales bacterium]